VLEVAYEDVFQVHPQVDVVRIMVLEPGSGVPREVSGRYVGK